MTDTAGAGTILFIHGVGDAPGEGTRSGAEEKLKDVLGGDCAPSLRWYSWNNAIEQADPGDTAYLKAVARGCRLAAQLDTPERVRDGGAFASLWVVHRGLARLRTPVLGLFLGVCLWNALAWAALAVRESTPPLRFGLRAESFIFPPVDGFILASTGHAARIALLFTLGAVVALFVLPFLLAVASRVVPFAVAFRCAALDAVVPLLALLTAPWHMLLVVFLLVGGVPFLLSFLSRPVQVVGLDGAPIAFDARLSAVLALLASIAAVILIGLLSRTLLKPLLKVVSDIVRYLGSADYRLAIHEDLRSTLGTLDPGPVIVVAHSLGTVIAVDSLLAHPEAWSRFPSVRLVTCGSPLRRTFHRFFATGFPAPDEVGRRLAERYRGFSWRNVYRPFDYIGARLGSGPCIVESPVPQGSRFHIGYWTDPHVLSIVADVLREQRPVDAELHEEQPGTSRAAAQSVVSILPLDRLHGSEPTGDRGLLLLAAPVLLAGIVLIPLQQYGLLPKLEREHFAQWEARLDSEGTDTLGELRPLREQDISEQVSTYERAVAGIAYRDDKGNEHVVAEGVCQRPDVDWDAVSRALFGRSPDSPLVSGLKAAVWIDDPLLAHTATTQISVRYLPGDPQVFRLATEFHRPEATGFARRTVRTLVLWGCWLGWWYSFAWLLFAVLGARIEGKSRLAALVLGKHSAMNPITEQARPEREA